MHRIETTQSIVVVGCGFAGLWSALGAARLLDKVGADARSIEVALIAPEPVLHLRTRLHEAAPLSMRAPLLPLFEAVGVRYIQGRVERIRAGAHAVDAVDARGGQFELGYDKLVLASGSRLHRPDLPGLHDHAYSIDQTDEAAALDLHFARLADQPATVARNTVVVVGGGFTGIEVASELVGRLRALWGGAAPIRIELIEQAAELGPDIGPAMRPTIENALRELGVAWRLNTTVSAVDPHGLTTSDGRRIEADTVIWTAGLRADALAAQIEGPRDRLGRLHVTDDLRVAQCPDVFAAGDVALALTDGDGHHTLMSCQHARMMGRFAGHNVAAALVGVPALPYRQPNYVTCLDLGAWGAIHSEGWGREVKFVGAKAKAIKRFINTDLIYPPAPDRAAALAAADPMRPPGARN